LLPAPFAPRTPWADLSKTGDNAGVDGTVVLLAAAPKPMPREGAGSAALWVLRSDIAPAGRIWRISASTGFGGNATVRINSLALSSWPIPTVYVH
jgi:hypothetical protein